MNKNDLIIRGGWPEDVGVLAAFLDRNWDYDRMDETLLREKLFDDPLADPELCLTAYSGNMIVGFLYAVRRTVRGQEFGYVKLMAVDEARRRQMIGSALYRQAEKLLVKKGATHIRWYDVPLNYFMPGIDPRYTAAFCFALKHGFKQFGEAINMVCDLEGQDFSTQDVEDAIAAEGIEVRRATHDDRQTLKKLLDAEWELWNNEVSMAMRDTPPSVHIAFKKGELKAFSVHNGNNKGTGWFGPMGTHPDMRGLGIGTILLKRCLNDMQQEGHKKAIIPWVAPIAFYSHFVNARINRVFWRMEKEV